jgi:succinate dehydrogenase hydrophobic anchor subunit
LGALSALNLLVGLAFSSVPLAVLAVVLVITVLSHTFDGVTNVIQDYIHNTKTELFILFSLQILQIEIFK